MSSPLSNKPPTMWASIHSPLKTWRGRALPPESEAALSPEITASVWSRLTFRWIDPLMLKGFSRPLESPDLWRQPDERSSAIWAEQLEAEFRRRAEASRIRREAALAGKIYPPAYKVIFWKATFRGRRKQKEWLDEAAKDQPSMVLALNSIVFSWFWIGGALKLMADVGTMCSPLLTRAIIDFSTDSVSARTAGTSSPSIGVGLGYAFGLLALLIFVLLCNVQSFYRSFTSGVILRSAIIQALFSHSLDLTNRARVTEGISTSKLVSLISADATRIDFCMGYLHMAWTAPAQMVVCLVLLCVTMGYSALPGFAFFICMSPLQGKLTKKLFALRKRSMVWTDKRVKLVSEAVEGIRAIKIFAWEILEDSTVPPFLNNAFAVALPAFAAVISILTYVGTGHSLDPGVIFSAISYFQLLRVPLTFLPVALNSCADAKNAANRLRQVFLAETQKSTLTVDRSLAVALRVEDASFTWEVPPSAGAAEKGSKDKGNDDELKARPFALSKINLEIERGALVVIFGAIGQGKTSLIQGLVGEMRRTSGSVAFGGSVSYCPQSPWLQSASVRQNILFGRPYDAARYNEIIEASCLGRDFELLPDGDMTEVGEKGIGLSGGQKARIQLARSAYSDSDIFILDDPMSALDAHVSRSVFSNVIQRGMSGKTRILVTHSVHLLRHADHVVIMENGGIIDQGTVTDLVARSPRFSQMLDEHGPAEDEVSLSDSSSEITAVVETSEVVVPEKKQDLPKSGIQSEERNRGQVSLQVYAAYGKAARVLYFLPLFLPTILIYQGSSIMSPYWLVWWQSEQWPISQGAYMGTYAVLAFGQAFGLYLMGCAFALFTFSASVSLHEKSVSSVLHAPTSFFDTTPAGRIMNRLSKDIDTIDSILGDSMRMFITTMVQIVGSIVLVSIILPYFLIAVGVLLMAYAFVAVYYRTTSREIKRLEALLRSNLYAHFSESLAGTATIRAYGAADAFRAENADRVDKNNRAYWLSVTIQRWLSCRLDFLGALLVFSVALIAVVMRFSISPAKIGVILSYMLSIQSAFGWAVRQSAEVENSMNAVERLLHYAEDVEQEAPRRQPEDDQLVASWPAKGAIEIHSAEARYRDSLPPVIKGIDLSIQPGEHIALVGRTGAGKSTMTLILYRLVELLKGKIEIDGVDISKVGLNRLRRSIAMIPQEATLFSGTLRTNLDPFQTQPDHILWDALRESGLVQPPTPASLEKLDDRPSELTLDSVVEESGRNFSMGQKSLICLARAIVKDSPIVILDEATASADYKTDQQVTSTISQRFANRTVICIAHRLRTILSYDKVCVMDSGKIVEFGTPWELFQRQDSVFRGLCEDSGVGEEAFPNRQ